MTMPAGFRWPVRPYCPACQGQGMIVIARDTDMYECGYVDEAHPCPTCTAPPPVIFDGKLAASGQSIDD